MSAVVEFLCVASHERRESGGVTIVDGHWAFCSQGAAADHEWRRIDATPMAQLLAMGPHAREELVTRTGQGAPGGLTRRDVQVRTVVDDVRVAEKVDESRVVRDDDSRGARLRGGLAERAPRVAVFRERHLRPALARARKVLRTRETSSREAFARLASPVIRSAGGDQSYAPRDRGERSKQHVGVAVRRVGP